jgi:uncharacterized membrane protein
MSVIENFETLVSYLVHWLRVGVEVLGALTIGAGCICAILELLKSIIHKYPVDFSAIRLTLARHLALALEFQLAADIVSTAIAPGWVEIGKLAAIAIIRTGLNYFLSKELAENKPDATSI